MNLLAKIFGLRRAPAVPQATLYTDKVLFILPWLPVGGVETLFAGIIKTLSPSYKFEAVTTREILPNMGNRTDSFVSIGCPVTDLISISDTEDGRSQALLEIIAKGRYGNIFLVGSTLAYDLLPQIKSLYPTMNVIDQLFNDGKHMSNNQKLHSLIDATIVPSQTLAEKLLQPLVDAEKTVHVIPHGIEIPDVQSLEDDLQSGTRMLPDEFKNKFVVSFFGRLSPEKDPAMFLHLVNELKGFPDIAFCMVGDGPERDNIVNLMSELNLTQHIFFSGFVDRIDPLVSASSVVLVPSKDDGQPLVVLHSQVHGKPVIGTRVGAIPLMIEDGYNGYLVDAGDIGAFREKICFLQANSDELKRLGQNAFTNVREKFAQNLMIQKYQKLLKSPDLQGS